MPKGLQKMPKHQKIESSCITEAELHDKIVEIMRSSANRHQIGLSNSAYRIIKLFKQTASNQQLLRELEGKKEEYPLVTHDFGTAQVIGKEEAVPLSIIQDKLKGYGEK